MRSGSLRRVWNDLLTAVCFMLLVAGTIQIIALALSFSGATDLVPHSASDYPAYDWALGGHFEDQVPTELSLLWFAPAVFAVLMWAKIALGKKSRSH